MRGRTYGEFEVYHPHTDELYVVHVYIDYTKEDDTYDTPGSLDWYYKVEWVEDEHNNKHDNMDWLTYDLMYPYLETILVNGLED